MFYEWDQSRTTTTSEDIGLLSTELEDLDKKRQRAGDDAIERLRMARVARGLGNGIQLPASMADCVELIMVNLTHLPTNRANLVAGEKRPTSQDQDSKKTKAFSLDSLIDMITTNGASLTRNDSRWYARDGGDFWNMDSTAMVSDDETDDGDESSMRSAISIKDVHRPARYSIDRKKYKIVSSTLIEGRDMEDGKVFKDECKSAASDAFHRIVCTSHASKDSSVTDLGNRIAARLAWTLKGVQPANELQRTKEVAVSGITSALMKESKPGGQHQSIPSHEKNSMVRIAEEFPLVPACLTHEILISSRQSNKSRALAPHGQSQSLTNRTMAEAYCLSSYDQSSDDFHPIVDPFDQILEIFLCSLVRICELADEKLNDVDLKKSAYLASTLLPHQIAIAPALTHRALKLISSLCDIEGVSKRAIEAASKSSNRSLASSAAAHGKNIGCVV
jgi:symplekin